MKRIINKTVKQENEHWKTVHFKFQLDDTLYWGNVELLDGKIDYISNYYIACQKINDDTIKVLGSNVYEEPEEYDCSECFDRHTEGWDEYDIFALKESLRQNCQHVCGTGYSFDCPYCSNGEVRHQGIYKEELEEILKEANIL